MKFRCPACASPCGLFDRRCAHCDLALTLRSVLGVYLHQARQATAVECPCCRQGALAVGVTVCPACGARPTFQDAVQAVVDPHRRRLSQRFAHASPQAKRRTQWLFLLASAAGLWGLLDYLTRPGSGSWVGPALLSILYIAAFGFFAVWLLPRRVLLAISRRATAKVKLALALNFFSGMLLLQLFIGARWKQTVLLAVLFVVLWASACVLNYCILPSAALTRAAFLDTGDPYQANSPQGRTARFD